MIRLSKCEQNGVTSMNILKYTLTMLAVGALACSDSGEQNVHPWDVDQSDPGTGSDDGPAVDNPWSFQDTWIPQKDNGNPGDTGGAKDTSGDNGVQPDVGTHDVTTVDGDADGWECLDSSECDLGNLCIDHECVPGCKSDRDCPDDLHCKPDALPHGFCLECLNDNHCDDGRCVAGACVHACETADDCVGLGALAPYCDSEDGVCVRCIDDSHCEIGQICASNACVEGCRSDRDCAEPLKCDPSAGANGVCVQCVDEQDCEGVLVCVNHQCVVDCAVVDCPQDRPFCLPETGECVECRTKTDCSSGRLCVNGACVTGCENDTDCNDGYHCLTGGAGSCVECFSDNHCDLNQKCSPSNVCIALAGCTKDTDCPMGNYCHPTLAKCHALPADSCSADEDCSIFPGFPSLEVCDPLTRTCISACIMDILCFDTTQFCVDGGCYGCSSNADCPGTSCDPFDSDCVYCGKDSHCVQAGWHCQTTSGQCFECLSDAHCGPTEVCHPDKHRCVDCLDNSDCTTASLPLCGKDNTCITQCYDQCTSGAKVCDSGDATPPIDYKTCGDWDNDPCTEWGSSMTCPSHQSCVSGSSGGECVCQDECESGDKACDPTDDTVRNECVESAYGCWYWSTVYCSYGEECVAGTCECSNECEVGQRKCDTNTNYMWLCENAYFSACPYWTKYQCSSGKTCKSGYCN